MGEHKAYKKQISILVYIGLAIVLSRVVMYLWFGIVMKSWSFHDFFNHLNTWDSGWYSEVAQAGYRMKPRLDGQATWAFFPMFPLIVNLVHRILPINLNILASCLSTLFLALAMLVLYHYVLLTRGDEKIGRAVVYFYCFGVFTFYASAFYSESLYMLLMISCFWFMKRKKYICMGICGALLSATRNTGILIVFAILAYRIQEFWAESEDRSIKGFILSTLGDEKLILGTCLVPLGLFSLMVYLKIVVGDALAFLHVQTAWWRVNSSVLRNLREALFSDFPPDYLGICAVVTIVLLGILLFKYKRIDEAVVPILVFVISGTSSLGSVPRYMWGSIFVLLTFTEELMSVRRRYVRILCYVCAFFLGLSFLTGWFHSSILLI